MGREGARKEGEVGALGSQICICIGWVWKVTKVGNLTKIGAIDNFRCRMHFKSRLKQTSDLLSLNNGFPFIIIDVLKTSSLSFLYTIYTILVMKYLINDSCNYKISNEMFIPQKK